MFKWNLKQPGSPSTCSFIHLDLTHPGLHYGAAESVPVHRQTTGPPLGAQNQTQRNVHAMKFKDFVTMGNLLFGFLAVIMLFHHKLDWACYMILFAWVFDIIDGPVARLTGQQDEFGGILDSTCDFVTNSIVPGFIIYYAFANQAGYLWPLAALLGFLPVAFGTIRQARYAVKNMSYPCYFIGLPRTVLCITVISLLQSSLFKLGSTLLPHNFSYHIVAAMIVIMSFMHLSSMPFISHHGGRKWMTYINVGKYVFLVGTPITFLVGLFIGAPWIVWDLVVFNMMVYIFFAWLQMHPGDMQRIRHYIKTGKVIQPLCHKDSGWQAKGAAIYFNEKPDLDI